MNRVMRCFVLSALLVGVIFAVRAQNGDMSDPFAAPMEAPQPAAEPSAEMPVVETPAPAPAEAPSVPAEGPVEAPPVEPLVEQPAAEPPAEAPAVPAEPLVVVPSTESPVESPATPAPPNAPASAEGGAETPSPAPAAPPSDLLDLLGNLQNVPPAPAPAAAPEEPVVEAPPPIEAPAPAPALGADQTIGDAVRELEMKERVRRQALEEEGKKALADARDAERAGDYQRAFQLYDEAAKKIPDRPQNEDLIRRARAGRANAAYQQAVAAYRRGDYRAARTLASVAAEHKDYERRARRLVASIQASEEAAERRAAQPLPPDQMPEVAEKQSSIEATFARAKQWFDLGDYDRAESLFEQILSRDPYHLDAMRFLKAIEERRLEAANVRRAATVEDMMQDVRERWNPPIRRGVAGPVEAEAGPPKVTASQSQQLREKMQEIIIPSISFRQASIVDVINFLREASEINDPTPQKTGVNIILQLDAGPAMPAPTPSAPTEDLFGIPGGTPPAEAPPETAGIPAITLTLRRVSLLDAIKYVTDVAGLKYRLEENAVIITPKDRVVNVMTRLYPVMPGIVDIATAQREESGAGAAGGGFGGFGAGGTGGVGLGGAAIKSSTDDDIKAMFQRMGVPFPPGTSLSYNRTISQLIVTNTPENLEILERILPQLDIVPKQVTIESRFVEVAQDDLQELGFEWMLTDTWQIANKRGSGPLASRERIQMNDNAATGGFTRGLRFFQGSADGANPAGSTFASSASMTGTLFSISSILTNPELTFVLHALQQKGGADLLSAPRVTTRSGVNAQIQVVQEIRYPTEYEEQSLDAGQFDIAFRAPLPTAFETREVGVILNVTPTVGPDGYTIDLTLVPEVAELSGWIDYGPPGRYPILQPVFSSRNITTSIVLWDNQTIAMGGMIRDLVTRFDDKVPVLGDIPLLGRLFRSKGERSSKRNLIVFVTARLINPAGAPIHEAKDAVGERW